MDGNIINLLKRGNMELEEGNWSKAEEFFEKVLEIDMETADAYLGKLMAELQVRFKAELSKLDTPFDNMTNYKRTIRFADDELKEELENYNRTIIERNEAKRLKTLYTKAVELIRQKKYTEAVEILKQLGSYEDTRRLLLECEYKIKSINKDKIYNSACELLDNAKTYEELDEAVKAFASIIAWKDSKEKIQQCRIKAEEIKNKKDEVVEETKEKKPVKDKPFVTRAIMILAIMAVLLTIVLVRLSVNDDKEDIMSVSAGYSHTIGLKSDGSVIAVGNNEYGQCEVEDWKDIVEISAGVHHTVGLKDDGSVVAVGNTSRQCEVEDWKDIVAISVGVQHTVGLKSDGSVVAAGSNYYGQCEVDDWEDIVAISAEWDHTVGLKSDGSVVAVGSNRYGQCEVEDWEDIVAISVGVRHAVGLKSDGSVVAVGYNASGQCDVDYWKDIVAISAGYSHTIGLKNDGSVVAVGNNYYGQCEVEDWEDMVAISAGYEHTIGLKSDGSVVAVGYNEKGQCEVEDWNLKNKTSQHRRLTY